MTKTTIEKIQNYLKNLLISILAFSIYFILPQLEGILFEILNINTETLSINIKIIYL